MCIFKYIPTTNGHHNSKLVNTNTKCFFKANCTLSVNIFSNSFHCNYCMHMYIKYSHLKQQFNGCGKSTQRNVY